MEVDCPSRVQNLRSTSINACFVTLGAKPEEVYIVVPGNKGIHRNKGLKGIYNRYSQEELEYMAKDLHRQAVKKYHPDQHKTRKSFYAKKFTEINAAYQRIKHILAHKSFK